MARQYKNYDEEFKKTLVSLYESGKGIFYYFIISFFY